MNCLNCGKENPIGKRKKKRKYCSLKCSKQYHNSLSRSKRTPGWGDKTKLAKEKKAQARKEYEWCKENMHTAAEIAEALSITPQSAFMRAKKLDIKGKIATIPTGGRVVFYSTEERSLIENYYEATKDNIPSGFIDKKEIAKLLGVTNSTLETSYFPNYGQPKGFQKFRTAIGSFGKYYPLKEVQQWFENITQTKANNLVERKQAILERQQQREQQRQLEKQLKEQHLKDNQLLTVKEAASFLGYSTLTSVLKLKIEDSKVIFENKCYYKQPLLEKHKVEFICKHCKNPLFGNRSKVYCSSTCRFRDINSHLLSKKSFDSLYEKRTYSRVRYKEENGLLRDCCLTHLDIYYSQYKLIQNGKNIPQKECKHCFMTRDITEYYVDLTYKHVRRKSCKDCDRSIRLRNMKPRIKSEKTFIIAFGGMILHELTKYGGKHNYIYRPQLWKEIKENLGYTEEDLIEHFESQFEAWMRWDNNGRVPKGQVRKQHWQMDHIRPRREFNYTSIDDEDFKKCWSLNNLQPIDAIDNITKG